MKNLRHNLHWITHWLARDSVRKEIKPSSRFEDGDFVAYALAVVEGLDTKEPKTYEEAMKSRKQSPRRWNKRFDGLW